MKINPVNFVWRSLDVVKDDGQIVCVKVMVPAPRYAALAARQYAEGEEYTLDQVEERSMASHRQYFAALKSGYDNLPERVFYRTKADGTFVLDETRNRVPKWPTMEHYRKWLLIETGWFDEKEFAEANVTYAKRLATWIRTEDVYARIFVRGSTVVVQRAKSQALPAMKKPDFEQSKKDVLALNDALSGVEPGTHWREAGNAA